jgi:formate dehydrogenase subunit gamma
MAVSYVPRFGRTERWLHWVHAGAFTLMLSTGAILYAPPLARAFADRPVIKAIHLAGAIGWVAALVVVIGLGDRRALGRTRAELERFDREDLLFLRRRPSRPGRFNGGQKAHAVGQAALLVCVYVSGALLWLGERDHAWRLPGTLALHDFCTLAGLVLLVGHVLKTAAAPGSLDGMVHGSVTAEYAAEHHPRWDAQRR